MEERIERMRREVRYGSQEQLMEISKMLEQNPDWVQTVGEGYVSDEDSDVEQKDS